MRYIILVMATYPEGVERSVEQVFSTMEADDDDAAEALAARVAARTYPAELGWTDVISTCYPEGQPITPEDEITVRDPSDAFWEDGEEISVAFSDEADDLPIQPPPPAFGKLTCSGTGTLTPNAPEKAPDGPT